MANGNSGCKYYYSHYYYRYYYYYYYCHHHHHHHYYYHYYCYYYYYYYSRYYYYCDSALSLFKNKGPNEPDLFLRETEFLYIFVGKDPIEVFSVILDENHSLE